MIRVGSKLHVAATATSAAALLVWLALPGATDAAAASSPVPPEWRIDDDELLGDCSTTNGCLFTALSGLVGGFTGGAGNQLWGWMLGGSESAGPDAIASALANIEGTLSTIEDQLGPNGPIVQQLKELQCASGSSWINAGPATTINAWYARYQNFLTELQRGINIPLGAISISNTDLTTLYGWANGVVQGNTNVAPNDVLTSMISLNNLTIATISSGTIADCVEAEGNRPVEGSLDDRPYYTENVMPIQEYLLNLNTQAMIVLTEAYHVYAYGECVTENGGDTSQCASGSADEIVPNLCPGNSASRFCTTPITIYGQLSPKLQGQFLPFVNAQFKAGGAPYSTDEYLMANRRDMLLIRSIEQYNAEAGANCPNPIIGTLCGPTVGPPGYDLPSIAVGPYGSGSGKGTWDAAGWDVFDRMLSQGYNHSKTTVSAGAFLCTMSLTGGNSSTCTQPNGGAGLKNVARKIYWFPETSNPYHLLGDSQCFLDGNLHNTWSDQPICGQDRFSNIIRNYGGGIFASPTGLVSAPVYPQFYVAEALLCRSSPCVEWRKRPTYLLPNSNGAYHWPGLRLSTLTCSNGSSATGALNPAGVPTMCGEDFAAWFNAQVPPGPTQLTAVADTTVSRTEPNANDGAGSRLDLTGRQALIAFDPDAIQAFLDAGPLDSARLIVTSSDTSTGGRRQQLVALSLLVPFVEGNGDVAAGDPGVGTGSTWSCALDVEIGDQAENCLEEWPDRIIGRWRSAPRLSVDDGHAGPLSFDVTEQVLEGVSAFLIHRERGGGGTFSLHSREGAQALGDPSLAPTLILTHPGEDAVAEVAGRRLSASVAGRAERR